MKTACMLPPLPTLFILRKKVYVPKSTKSMKTKISGPLYSKETEAFFSEWAHFSVCSYIGPIYAEFHTLFKRVQVYMNFLFSDLYDVHRFRKRGSRNGQ